METYVFAREVLGSFGLVLMFVFFVATVIWVLTGRKESYARAADVIFRHEDKPAGALAHDTANDRTDDRVDPSDTRQEARS